MIMLLDDWRRYPNAIVDMKTTNRSFVEMAYKYKKMGIKNYFFHLALMDKELVGIDPFSQNVFNSQELMERINIEAKINPWYFFREIYMLPQDGSSEGMRIRANRGNLAAYFCYYNHIDYGATHPRQTGKSVGADGIASHVIQVAGQSTKFVLITKDVALRRSNIMRLKRIREYLPAYMNMFNPKIDSDNQIGLTTAALNNEYVTFVAQANEEDALNGGRGITAPNIQNDEGPFCKNIHITMDAALSSSNAARDNAARNNSFYGNIFTTTAGPLDTVEGKFMYNFLHGSMSLDERLLFDAANQKDLHRIVHMNSRGERTMVYINLSHRQMGFSDEWLYDKLSNSSSSGDAANRDYFGIWTTIRKNNPIDEQYRRIMHETKRTCDYIEHTEHLFHVKWYVPEDKIPEILSTRQCVLGNDGSNAIGADSITLVLFDVETMEVYFTFNVNETNVYTFTKWFVDYVVTKSNVFIIPERQSSGFYFIDALIATMVAKNVNPFKRIFNRIVNDSLHLTHDKYKFINRDPSTWPLGVVEQYGAWFGYPTTGNGPYSRQNLFKPITQLAKISADRLYDATLIEQITSLETGKNGRIDHQAGGHDDLVIAWLLAGWWLMHGRNLDFYGIRNPLGEVRDVLEARKEKKEAKTVWDIEREREIKGLQTTLLRLIEDLEECDVEWQAVTLEDRIRALSERLPDDKVNGNSITEMIDRARKRTAEEHRSSVEIAGEANYTRVGNVYIS